VDRPSYGEHSAFDVERELSECITVGEILREARRGTGNLNVGTSSNGRAEGRTKMEPTTGRHAYDVAILILAGVIWPPVVVVEMVTALMMVRPSSPHHVAALLSLRGLT